MLSPTGRNAARAALAGLVLIATASPALAQEQPGELKVGVIDVPKLLEESDPGRKGLEDLKALRLAQNERQNALQDELDELEQRLVDGDLSLSAEKKAELEKRAEDKRIELDRFTVDAQRELQANQSRMLSDIEEMLMPIIDAVGSEKGYSMIFHKYQSGLVYMSETVDITPLVMERLNRIAAESAPAENESSGSSS